MSYKICTNCIMDTSDPNISFDENGICDHCNQFRSITLPLWKSCQKKESLEKLISKIKNSSKKSNYNCILGLSGGVDSSYMLHLAVKEFGLKPLVFHVDGGWNSNISTTNIEKLVNKLGLDLFTDVINWEEMRKFQLAYLRSGVPHIDIPQDLAFIATLYKYANKNNIKWILNGGNFSTECVRNPLTYFYYGSDMKHNNYIRKNFGAHKMPTYPFSSVLWHKVWLRYVKRVKVIKLLNYVDYDKENAVKKLQNEYGWKPYAQKHFESRFTKFFEGYWLPKRFGFDSRRVQFSSLILTNQMTREEALEKISKSPFTKEEGLQEYIFIADKLEIEIEELNKIFQLSLKYYYDYPNSFKLFDFGARMMQRFGLEASIKK